MKNKEIKIDLLPEDFVGNYYEDNWDCPLVRACKRYFKGSRIIAGSETLEVDYKKFIIKKLFNNEDYEYVKSEYSKKNCNKIFQVTLIPV